MSYACSSTENETGLFNFLAHTSEGQDAVDEEGGSGNGANVCVLSNRLGNAVEQGRNKRDLFLDGDDGVRRNVDKENVRCVFFSKKKRVVVHPVTHKATGVYGDTHVKALVGH